MIITLCGSARFEQWFHIWNHALGLAGHASFGLCSYPSFNDYNKNWYTEEQKTILDAVHINKIIKSDAVVVLNPFGYMGESTLKEFQFAKVSDKQIYFLESWGKGCGVGINHKEKIRVAKLRFGLKAEYMSPINTYGYPPSFDLLGPPSKYRSNLVDWLREQERKVYYGEV